MGADWLLAAIAPRGALGRAARERERAFTRGDEGAARRQIERVAQLAREFDGARLGALRAIVEGLPDPRATMARAQADGLLDDVELFEIAQFVEALGRITESARGAAFVDFDVPPACDALASALAPGRRRDGGFYLDDTFDPELAAARGEAAACQAVLDTARSRLTLAVARYAGVASVRDGEFVLLRETLRGPLPPEVRVVREAPTYLLCEIALDEQALAALAARDAAAERVAAAEEAVRARLSATIGKDYAPFARACEALGELETLLARAAFAQHYGCVVPTIVEATHISFADARYLPLAEALERRGRRYEAISLSLDGVGVVTGPNLGGKTAALRTLGFVAACVALGVPVPAAAADVPLVDEFVWLGGGADGAEDDVLSAFGAEAVALRALFAAGNSRALVLVDEFARTTSAREAFALLVSLVEALRARGAIGLMATHVAGVASRAHAPHYAVGGLRERAGLVSPSPAGSAASAPLPLDLALARIAEAMDYRVAPVAEDAPSPSDAVLLAEALGVDAGVVARARQLLGE